MHDLVVTQPHCRREVGLVLLLCFTVVVEGQEGIRALLRVSPGAVLTRTQQPARHLLCQPMILACCQQRAKHERVRSGRRVHQLGVRIALVFGHEGLVALNPDVTLEIADELVAGLHVAVAHHHGMGEHGAREQW